MPGVGTLGNLVIAAVIGGGLLWYLIRKLNAAEVQRARADTLDSAQHADAQATQDEAARRTSRENAEQSDKGLDSW